MKKLIILLLLLLTSIANAKEASDTIHKQPAKAELNRVSKLEIKPTDQKLNFGTVYHNKSGNSTISIQPITGAPTNSYEEVVTRGPDKLKKDFSIGVFKITGPKGKLVSVNLDDHIKWEKGGITNSGLYNQPAEGKYILSSDTGTLHINVYGYIILPASLETNTRYHGTYNITVNLQ